MYIDFLLPCDPHLNPRNRSLNYDVINAMAELDAIMKEKRSQLKKTSMENEKEFTRHTHHRKKYKHIVKTRGHELGFCDADMPVFPYLGVLISI